MAGGPDIPQRRFGKELPKIFGHGLQFTEQGFKDFVGSQPLLTEAQDAALKYHSGAQGLIDPLQALMGRVPAEFAGYRQQIGGLIPGLQNLITSQQGVYNQQLMPVLNTGGALTPQMARDVTQATRAGFAERGNVVGNQALGQELLNRDQYRQQRFNEALQQATGLSGSIGGLTGQEAGLVGQQAGLTQQEAGLQSGLAGATQTLQQGDIDMLNRTEQGQIGSYKGLIDPLLSYGSDLFSSNQNAQAAENVAGANKGSSALGAGLSVVGSIAAAY